MIKNRGNIAGSKNVFMRHRLQRFINRNKAFVIDIKSRLAGPFGGAGIGNPENFIEVERLAAFRFEITGSYVVDQLMNMNMNIALAKDPLKFLAHTGIVGW